MFVPDRDSGSRLATVFEREFNTSLPSAIKPEPLEPVVIEWALFGENLSPDLNESPPGNWTAGKLFMQETGVEAEVFFNFDLTEGVGRFSEKDEDYRDDLVFFMVERFRDGVRLKRTPKEDANLTANGPRLDFKGPIARSNDCEFGFMPSNNRIWLADSKPGGELRLVTLADPRQELVVGHFDGVITVHPIDREGNRLVIDERIQNSPNAYSSDDEHRIWLIDQLAGTKTRMSGPWGKLGSVDSVSDDGRFVALSCWTHSATRNSVNSHVNYFEDLQNGRTVEVDVDGTTSAWTGSGESTRAFLKQWSRENGHLEFRRSVTVTTGTSELEHFASCWRASRRKMLLLSLKGVTAWKPIRRKFEN